MSRRSKLRETAEHLLRKATTPATLDQLLYWITELYEADHQMAEHMGGGNREEFLVRFIGHYRQALEVGVELPACATALKHDIAMAEAELAELDRQAKL